MKSRSSFTASAAGISRTEALSRGLRPLLAGPGARRGVREFVFATDAGRYARARTNAIKAEHWEGERSGAMGQTQGPGPSRLAAPSRPIV